MNKKLSITAILAVAVLTTIGIANAASPLEQRVEALEAVVLELFQITTDLTNVNSAQNTTLADHETRITTVEAIDHSQFSVGPHTPAFDPSELQALIDSLNATVIDHEARIIALENPIPLEIVGYDARAVSNLFVHDGNQMIATSGAVDPNLEADERIAIYVTNTGANTISLGDVQFALNPYTFVDNTIFGMGNYDTVIAGELRPGEYTILTGTSGGDQLSAVAEILAGQTVSLIIDLVTDPSVATQVVNIEDPTGTVIASGLIDVGVYSP